MPKGRAEEIRAAKAAMREGAVVVVTGDGVRDLAHSISTRRLRSGERLPAADTLTGLVDLTRSDVALHIFKSVGRARAFMAGEAV